jgi:CHAT domain-containing protein/Tfp pilus assembly protein PilF
MSGAARRIGWIAWLLVLSGPGGAASLQDSAAVVVDDVLAESPAAKAGIAVADRVVSYDGRPLRSPAALAAMEENTVNPQPAAVEIQRDGGRLVLTLPRGKSGIQARHELSASVLTLYHQGRTALKAQQPKEAVEAWLAAARAAREGGDAPGAAWLYSRAGEALEGQRGWKEAHAAYAEAWSLQERSDPAAQSRTLLALGRCSQNLNDATAAERWFEQAEQVDTAAGYELWAAADINHLAILTFSRNPALAQEYFQRVLAIRERLIPDSQGVGVSLYNLGTAASRRGDLESAHQYLARALAVHERVAPVSRDIADTLTNLGNVVYRRGDLEQAREYYSRALAINEALAADSIFVANSLDNLGNALNDSGDLTSAQRHYERALAIKERLAPGSLAVATTFHNLGQLARGRNDLTAAQTYLSRALEIRERLARDSVDMARTLTILGNVARARGDLTAALDYQVRALAINERLSPGSLDVAATLNNLGLVGLSRGDLDAAEDHFNRSLAIKERLAPNSLSYAATAENLGAAAESRGDLPRALAHYSRALELKEQLAPTSLAVAGSLESLGNLALKQRRYADALPLFTRAVGIIEAQRWQVQSTDARALLLSEHVEAFTGLLRTQIALNDVAGAFATAERTRARSLVEMLGDRGGQIRSGVEPALLQRERALQQSLNAEAARQMQVLDSRATDRQAATRQKLDALLVQYRELQAKIRASSPRYADLTQPRPLGLEAIQQLLDRDTVLLEYVLGDNASILFAVTAGSIRSFELPARDEIGQAARRVVESVMARQSVPGESLQQRRSRIGKADDAYAAAASALSRMILGPVAAGLSDQRLVIVADGALQYVPFAALPLPSKAGDVPLIMNHEVISLPSASVLAALRETPAARRSSDKLIAVLADPVFDTGDPRLKRPRQGQANQPAATTLPAELAQAVRTAGLVDARGTLSRLPFTRDEADAILGAAPPGANLKALDFMASRGTVTGPELERYRIVHIATHGVLDTERPELSGIVLSLVDEHGRPHDGFLRLHEVYNLNWSADLVVLSGCQTALGKEIKGEGLVGLTRGFMYAGSKRVVASLWNVSDSVTAQFMKRFYQGVFVEGLRPAAALRAAQLALWKSKASSAPYYWAAFVLHGEWQ